MATAMAMAMSTTHNRARQEAVLGNDRLGSKWPSLEAAQDALVENASDINGGIQLRIEEFLNQLAVIQDQDVKCSRI
jgi:hypothetical protein